MKQYTFRATEFTTARGKQLVLNAWVRFLKHGLRAEDFSERLYKHLTNHCSFIAHYDLAGFYAEYFERGEDAQRFLSQFDKGGDCLSVEYGGRWWLSGPYEDLNTAMVEEAAQFIPKLMETARAKQRESDLARAQELAGKYGLSVHE